MTDAQSIQSIESIKLLLYLTTSVLIVTSAIIGYFLKRRDNASINREIAVTTATENLTTAVQQLKLVVAGLQIQYEVRQPLIDAQLELYRTTFLDIAGDVAKLDTRLTRLETEHKLMSCKYPTNNITINNEGT